MLASLLRLSRALPWRRERLRPVLAESVASDAPVDIDYPAAYSSTDLQRDHWTITGPSTREEYDRLSGVKLQYLVDLGLRPESRLLDVGCGTGQLAQACEAFLSDDGLYFGTDLGESGIAFCRERFKRPNFQFRVNRPTSLPIDGLEFDAACFFSVFTHTYPDETVLLLAETERLLAPGGWILADLFTAKVADRYRGNRGALVVDRDHFLRLAAVAGFPKVDRIVYHGGQFDAMREFFQLSRG